MSTADLYLELGESNRQLSPSQPVGFDHLPNQLVDYEIKKGFSFNIMCIGETGSEPTRCNIVCGLVSADSKESLQHVTLNHYKFLAHEGPVHLTMRVSESVNYGDFIDKSDSSGVFVDYVKSQLKEYYTKKQMVHRNLRSMHDNRVHLCFYLIPSSCARLKLIDIITMKALSNYVNIIPLISKCDSLTKEELTTFKIHVREQLLTNDIKIYKFPTTDSAVSDRNSKMNDLMPFGVVSANTLETINGKPSRVRKLPWGMVKIDDETHCDVSYLREMIFRVNMDDIIHSTSANIYSNFKTHTLQNEDVNILRLSLASKQIKKKSGIDVSGMKNQEEKIRSAFNEKMTALNNQHQQKLANMKQEFQQKTDDINIKIHALHAAIEATATDKKGKKKK